MPTIRSDELFAFLLQAKTFPCSVPTMNLVGMVGSYSKHVAPWACKEQQCKTGSDLSLLTYIFCGAILFFESRVKD